MGTFNDFKKGQKEYQSNLRKLQNKKKKDYYNKIQKEKREQRKEERREQIIKEIEKTCIYDKHIHGKLFKDDTDSSVS